MENNIFWEHRVEIIAIGNEDGVDWSTATEQWQRNTYGDVQDDLASQEQEFLAFVNGKKFSADGSYTEV